MINEKLTNPETAAAALYDGGWRASDRDELAEEYDLTPADADKICEYLAKFDSPPEEL